MKSLSYTGLFVLLLASCGPDNRVEAATPRPAGSSTSTKSGADTKVKLDTCESNYETLKRQCNAKQEEINNAAREIEQLKKELENARKQLFATGVRDPTWDELRDFIIEDKGDEKVYDIDRFNCQAFALELRDHARDRNLRGAYVILNYVGENVGHAINAFETLDHGLVYIEPQSDEVAYVSKGKPVGGISVDAVKRRYFACPTGPKGFADTLEMGYFQGKLFEYEYFENFEARSKCYEAGSDALNRTINDYNERVRKVDDATDLYNRGRSHFTHSEIRQMHKELEDWGKEIDATSNNLKAFRKDLGKNRSSSKSVVSKIKAHWN